MKLVFRVLLSVFFVGAIFFVNVSDISAVLAEKYSGSWVLPDSSEPFDLVIIDEEVESAPNWLQRFSDGIKINTPNQICYNFRYGDYKWIPQIRLYKDNSWVKIPTTTSRIFGEERPLYACAEAPRAGIYALFGYYAGPREYYSAPSDPGFDCSTITWSYAGSPGVRVTSSDGGSQQTWQFNGVVTGVPVGTTINWYVTDADPTFYVGSNGYEGSTTLNASYEFSVTRYIENPTPFSVLTVLFTESTHGCTHTASLLPD